MRLLGTEDYGWVLDLDDPDPVARTRAVRRQQDLLEAWRGSRRSPTGTLVDLVADPTYGLLFLRWELDYPDDWRDAWLGSPWSTKRQVLRRLAGWDAGRMPADEMRSLIVSAVERRHRCGDRDYWMLARRVEDPSLRERLAHLAVHSSARTRMRAGFLLHLLAEPHASTSPRAWQRWRRTVGDPLTHPLPAAQLQSMPAVDAARTAVGLGEVEIAAMLEGVELGPAQRILACLLEATEIDPAVVRGAFALMDPLLARHTCRVLPTGLAAVLLEPMEAIDLGPRLPSPARGGNHLDLIQSARVPAVLAAMDPELAGSHLGHMRFGSRHDAREVVLALDLATAGRVVPEMGWSIRDLGALPTGVADAIVTHAPWRHRRWLARALREARRPTR